MRRSLSALLVAISLFVVTPAFARSTRDRGDTPILRPLIRVIKKFVRSFIPIPDDAGDYLIPPKP